MDLFAKPRLLTELILRGCESEANLQNTVRLDELLSCIAESIDQPLPVASMAKQAALSSFFARVFKEEIGQTPHAYLVSARINRVRFFLKTTNLP